MNKTTTRTMNTNIETYQQKLLDYLARFRDIRFTGQIVFVVIVLLISWSGIKSIQTNYGLQKQIATLKQQNDVQQLQNNNQDLQNQYYKTNQYLELSARQNFGLANLGEKELLVPQSVAYSYPPSLPQTTAGATAVAKQHTSNFQAWVNFFLHRQ